MPATLSGFVVEFGEYQLDCGRFELLRNGRYLRVERKPMELLVLLATREGEIVTRTEIAQRLWSSEVFVDTEHGINTAIGKLRHVLRDNADRPRFIQTVTGTGYRFIAPVSPVSSTSVVAPVPAEAPSSDTEEGLDLAPAVPLEIQPPLPPAAAAHSPRRSKALLWSLGAVACVVVAGAATVLYQRMHTPPAVRYTQLTDFTDSAVAPALSPDGHMLAFIRGSSGFLTTDQIYVKMLPSGEARRVTDDAREKYGLAFSPDGSEIAYTVLDHSGFSTYEVSALGGEPHLLMDNAAGLTWLTPEKLLFSETRTGIHLGVVTGTAARTDLHDIYFPEHERGMAHYSFPSPDQRWALVVEMNGNGNWAQCRLIALEGHDAPRVIGPSGPCTYAGWSPDGSWMYFTAAVDGRSHVWRQHFPDGEPEQLTSGPMEEYGLAVESTGQALITSVGAHESAIWVYDGTQERPLSSEGEVLGVPSPATFAPDNNTLYYLLRRGDTSAPELWRTAVDTGTSEAVFPDTSINSFDLSPDGKQVLYTNTSPDGEGQLWLAPVDRSAPATKLDVAGARSPHFGPHGQILFLHAEENNNYLEQIAPNSSHPTKVFPYPILDLQSISPGRHWITAAIPTAPAKALPAIMAIPLDGGAPRRICANFCRSNWSTDGRFLFLSVEEASLTSPGRTLAVPIGADEKLPDLPPGGIAPLAHPDAPAGIVSIPHASLVPGKDPNHYAWVNTTAHRNLYRISLP